MEKVDRRIQRTQHALMDALVTLSLEKGYDAISHPRHHRARQRRPIRPFFATTPKKMNCSPNAEKCRQSRLTTLINHNPNKSREAEGKLIFQHVADNQAFFRVLFSSQGTSRVMRNIQDEIAADHPADEFNSL